jgi:hypothetical protein
MLSLLKNATSLKINLGDRDNKDTRTDLSLLKDVAVAPKLNNMFDTSSAAFDPFLVSKPGQLRTIFIEIKVKYIYYWLLRS